MAPPYEISGNAIEGAEVFDKNHILTGILDVCGNILSPYDATYQIGASINGSGQILDLCGNIVPLAPTINRGGPSDASGNYLHDIKWLDTYRSNRHIQTYYNGFVDISGGDLYLREGCNAYFNAGDLSLNGMIATPEIVIHENSITSKNKVLNIVPANRGNHNNTGTVKVKGNMTIDGSLNFIGDYIITNTNVTVTEQIDISNDGTGPALIARQMGDESVVEFYDDAEKVFEILDGGNTEIHRALVVNHDASHSFCKVGIGLQPIFKLDVSGDCNISKKPYDVSNVAALMVNKNDKKGRMDLGVGQLGFVKYDNWAMFAHKDHAGPTNNGWGFGQDMCGNSYINAKSGEIIRFSINDDQRMLMDPSGIVTINHNTSYNYPNNVIRHVPIANVNFDVSGSMRIVGNSFFGNHIDVSNSNIDLSGGKLCLGNGSSFYNNNRMNKLLNGNSFTLEDYTNSLTDVSQNTVGCFEGSVDLYGITFVDGTHLHDNFITTNGRPYTIQNTTEGGPTFRLIQDYDDMNGTDNDFIQCISKDFPNNTESPFKSLVVDISGNIAIRNNNPVVSIDISGADAIRLPSGTNLERPNPGVDGYIRFNKETNVYEGYSNGYWDTITVLQDVDQDTKIIAQDNPAADNDQLKFFTSGIERMRLDFNGKVGIGTTYPQTELHICNILDTFNAGKDLSNSMMMTIENKAAINFAGQVDYDAGLVIKSKERGECIIKLNNNGQDLFSINSGVAQDIGAANPTKNFSIYDEQNSATRLSIDKSNGNVGIGTMFPKTEAKMEIVGNLFLDNITGGQNGTNAQGSYLQFDEANGMRGPNKIKLSGHKYGFGVKADEVTYFSQGDHVFYYGGSGWTGTDTNETATLAMELRNKALKVHGDISGNATGSIFGTFAAGKDKDEECFLGRAAIGFAGTTDVATFSHLDRNTAIDACVRQETNGDSVVNGTNILSLKVGNTDIMRFQNTNKNIGISTDTTLGKFHIHETSGIYGASHTGGTITLSHGDQGGSSSIIFKNKLSDNVASGHGNDFGYIRYTDSYQASLNGRGLLEIGSRSNTGEANRDSVVIQKEGGYVGIGTEFPKHGLHVRQIIPRTQGSPPTQSNMIGMTGALDSSLNVFYVQGLLTGGAATARSCFGPIAKIESTGDFTQTLGNVEHQILGFEVNLQPNTSVKYSNKIAARFLGGSVGVGVALPSEIFEVSGNILASEALIANSDKRIKTNITTIDNALDKVNKLRGVYYNKISNEKKHIGVIGQEIEHIFPELVETYNEREGFKDFKGVNYAHLVAPLIEAIKDLTMQNKSLSERISALENSFS